MLITNPFVLTRNRQCNVGSMRYVSLLLISMFFGTIVYAQSGANTFLSERDRKTKFELLQDFNRTQSTTADAARLIETSNFKGLAHAVQLEVLGYLSNAITIQIQKTDPVFAKIFTSKIYKFTNAFLLKSAGLNFKEITDVTGYFDLTKRKYILVLLSIAPIQNLHDKKLINSRYGFFVQKIGEMSSAPKKDELLFKASWLSNSEIFDVQVKLKKKLLQHPIVTTDASADYKKLLQDKVFKTVITISDNIDKIDHDYIFSSYLKFYRERGLELTKKFLIPDTKKYFSENFSGAEPMDIFIKEAHSSGDEKNLMSISRSSTVYRIEKTHAEYKEVVEIVVPYLASAKSELISNQEFGLWMQQRKHALNLELIYLNTSCWSDHKAVLEVVAANTNLLVIIPSISITTYLNAYDRNGTYQLVDGFRKMLTYEQIKDQLYAYLDRSKHTTDRYIFPGQPEYKKRISDALPPNLEVVIDIQKIVNGVAIPYSIETGFQN